MHFISNARSFLSSEPTIPDHVRHRTSYVCVCMFIVVIILCRLNYVGGKRYCFKNTIDECEEVPSKKGFETAYVYETSHVLSELIFLRFSSIRKQLHFSSKILTKLLWQDLRSIRAKITFWKCQKRGCTVGLTAELLVIPLGDVLVVQ